MLLALGILNQLPIRRRPNLLFIPSIVAGVSGVLGLSFTWHRALVVYTLSAWLALAFTVWQIANLALHDPANVIAWIMWLASAVFSVPAAFLSTTLHAVRVWRSRASLLGEQQAPLVGAAAPAGGALRVAQAAASWPGASRPVWPPPTRRSRRTPTSRRARRRPPTPATRRSCAPAIWRARRARRARPLRCGRRQARRTDVWTCVCFVTLDLISYPLASRARAAAADRAAAPVVSSCGLS